MGLKALLESEDWLHDDSMDPETHFELQGISGEGRPLPILSFLLPSSRN
ncbi:hypothetical protein OROMI_003152 [Orobanche minor]